MASFWTSGVSSWVPLMTLLMAAREWWILCDNTFTLANTLRLYFGTLVPGVSFDISSFDYWELVHYES